MDISDFDPEEFMNQYENMVDDIRERRKVCSHVWTDPDEQPFFRKPVTPLIGHGANMMHPGRTYKCNNCGETLSIGVKR
jgi:hypothetical protein